MVDQEALLRDTIGNGDATMPKSARPQMPIRPALAPNVPPVLIDETGKGNVAELLLNLDRSLGAMPWSWVRDARTLARRHNCEAEFTAIEDDFDAIVSARE